MPTKHVNDVTWRKVEQETVKRVMETKENIKDTEVLDLLIKKGLETITTEDYVNFLKKKRKEG